jgi:superfamily I DNA and/or RNA helicase
MDKLSAELQRVCKQIQESSVRIVAGFLKKRYAVHVERIFGGVSQDPCAGLDSELRDDAALETWVSGDAPGDLSGSDAERSVDQLLLAEVWTLKNSERARLYQYWLDSASAELSQQFHDLVQKHLSAKQQYTSLINQSSTQFLDRFHIIGVTTTGLANNSNLLRGLRTKVLICEEAGEVLEAHVLTVLLPSIQHAILIGDHLQLRPRISNLKLSMEYDRAGPKYNLDESLFERLANSRFESCTLNGEERRKEGDHFPVAQLDHQRRMHPTISTLVRETLYPKLCDHPDTTCYPEVSGMRRRLFWLDHRNMEDAGDAEDPMQSKTNMWEARMVTALARHLCRQGKYRPGEIAVLTPYMGQLRILKDMLAEVVELIIGEKDLEELCASDAGADMKNSDVKKGRPLQGRQRKQQQRQMVGKGKLLDELRVASVDNFQVRDVNRG